MTYLQKDTARIAWALEQAGFRHVTMGDYDTGSMMVEVPCAEGLLNIIVGPTKDQRIWTGTDTNQCGVPLDTWLENIT